MKILIVEDYVPFANTLTSLVHRMSAGVAVRAAYTLSDAEDAMHQDGPADIIFLDIGLPDSTGFDGLRRMLAAAPEAQIAMISADMREETVRGAFDEGARAYIPKSLSPEDFEAGLETFLKIGFYVPREVVR